MYINQKNVKIIFIHIPKNMGTFIEYLLMYNLGMSNIFRLKIRQFGKEYDKLFKYNDYSHYFKNNFRSHHHLPLDYYINIIGKSEINKFKIFVISRNPFDRIISLYKFTNSCTKNKMTFDYFMESNYFKNNKIHPHFSKLQIDFIRNYEKLDQLTILKFENIHNIEKYFKNELRFTFINKKINCSRAHKIILNKKQIEQVKQYYKEDFIFFDYSFDYNC